MKTLAARTCALLLTALAVTGGARAARADVADSVAGRYEVKYEEVTSNCQNTGMVLVRGVLELNKRKATTVAVDIDRIPLMAGSAAKGGRVKATSKLGPTSIQGLDGRFSVAGTVNDDGVLSMVLVAEYYVKNKAYCTQSWNVTGVRTGAVEPKAKKTADEPTALVDEAMPMLTPARWLPPAE